MLRAHHSRFVFLCTLLGAGCRLDSGVATDPVLDLADGGPRWGPWSAPQNLGAIVNSSANDQQPAISRDGLTLYISSNRPGGSGGLDLWVSHRTSLGDPWQTPVNLGSVINSNTDDLAPTLTPDGHHLYYHSSRSGGCGAADLYLTV